eukprot:scaffold71755_cov43-Cyclotella_meneghiniana.AAC.3
MWLVLPQNIYFALTAENVVSPIQPPQVPPYNPLGAQTENALISIQWQKNMELWTTVKNVNAALIAAARTALDQKTQAALTNLFLGTPDRVFLDFCNKLYNKWGKSKPQDVKANDDKMNTPWDLNVNNKAELLNQIRTAFTTGERLVMQTGLFNEQYKMWRRKPVNEREWIHFDSFWTKEYDLWLETSRTADSMGFGGNVEEEVSNEEAAFYNIASANSVKPMLTTYPPSRHSPSQMPNCPTILQPPFNS